MRRVALKLMKALTWISFALIITAPIKPAIANEGGAISEVVVTSQRREQPKLLHAGNIDRLDQVELDRVQHQHIQELLNRVAGTWIVRGSGQENQAAIRSPALTGGGSCGVYLLLEDGIPIRPAGFCNVNQLSEIIAEQAHSVEVIRGPGNALYGSNALHGIVNVLMPSPGVSANPNVALETGANSFVRTRAALPFARDASWLGSIVYADDGGFRDDSGYQQGKLHVKRSGSLFGGTVTAGFSATDLQQETAGFILGKDAYMDESISRSNPNPEAFRDASSQRLYALWKGSMRGFDLDIRPYFRYSDMRFMHHGLPGKPVEENGHISTGVISAATIVHGRQDTVVGMDLEWSDIFLEQTQFGPADGPPPRRETRPQGKHYDYQVSAVSIAPFVQTEYHVSEKVSLGAGLRMEYVHYDYDNRMLAGNTRDDGTVCGFGGCLYTRPADRTDSFINLAPKLSASYQFSSVTRVYANLARGFRAPQTIELYRLQSGQQVSDLDSERIDSFEAGLRTSHENISLDLSAFTMKKRDSVFRDAEGFNVSGARSKHRGIEAAIDWQMTSAWLLAIDASYARHTYDFNFNPGRGEIFVAGRDIQSAPRLLGSAELLFEPGKEWKLGLQWSTVDDYYLDTRNRFSYPGHSLVNLRVGRRISQQLGFVLRLNNIADERYADRANYASGNYRYLPARGRELFVEFRYTPL